MAKFLDRKYFSAIIIVAVVVLLLNIVPGFSKKLGNFVFKVFSPIRIFVARIGDKTIGFFEIIINIKNLNRENIELRQQNKELEGGIVKLKELERENEELKQALKISSENQNILEKALIVGKDVQGIQDWILINRGKKHGIEKDLAVVSKEMALVGRVVEVMDSFSKVMLITNKDCVVAAIAEKSRAQGLVKKEEKGGLFMDFIPRTERLETGERIITSGMDKIYPKAILIGKIEKIDLSQNQLFQKITIIPAVDFGKLESVFIIK